MFDYNFHWRPVLKSLPDLFEAGMITLQMAALSMVIGIVVGLLLALLRMNRSGPLRWIANIWVETARNTPALIQLFFFSFGLGAFGLHMTPYMVVLLGLSFNNAGYLAENFRGGFQTIPETQLRAARSLGMTAAQSYVRIIIPQVLKIVYHPMTNQMVWAVLMSSLGMLVGFHELSGETQRLASRTFRIFEYFAVASIFYYVVVKVILSQSAMLSNRKLRPFALPLLAVLYMAACIGFRGRDNSVSDALITALSNMGQLAIGVALAAAVVVALVYVFAKILPLVWPILTSRSVQTGIFIALSAAVIWWVLYPAATAIIEKLQPKPEPVEGAIRFFTGFGLNDLKFMGQAALRTLWISVLAISIGSFLGLIFGWLLYEGGKVSTIFLAPILDVFRSVPLIIQLVLFYNFAPIVGLNLDPFASGVVILTIYTAALVANVAKGGIEAVGTPMRRASRSLGLGYWQDMRYVVLPIGLRAVFPSWVGVALGVMKDSALVSVLGYEELLKVSQYLITRTQEPLLILTIAGAFYFALSYPISRYAAKLEKRWAR